MPQSSLSFGTSGLRGLASDLQGQAARRYTRAFLQFTRAMPTVPGQVFLGCDLRPSSPTILRDCALAVSQCGLEPVFCGFVPTPALALHARAAGGAAIMITGSHIPADRNGLKFYLPSGEISKADEAGIAAALVDGEVEGTPAELKDESAATRARYMGRCAGLLPKNSLSGLRIGVYQHTSVARDLLVDILADIGADIVPLGRLAGFVPVDTEAFSDPVLAPLPDWVREHGLDAIVSADGDGDRPLLMDGDGQFVRGDVLGLLAAQYLRARTIVTPVTSNSGLEQVPAFERVVRTRVGSPYVVEAMSAAGDGVVGFEANGGTFVGRGIDVDGTALPPLETRDAVLPLLCALGQMTATGKTLAQIQRALPLMQALAGRLQNVPPEKSGEFLDRLRDDTAYVEELFASLGVSRMATIDGVQIWTASNAMVHFRASGNAPELRCYVEAEKEDEARRMLDWGLRLAQEAVGK